MISSTLQRPSSAPERSVLNVQFRVSTLANAEFKALSSKSRQNEETGAIIKRTFDPVIIRKTFERSIINLHVLVLQSDGGVLSAAINAASLALADASIPMLDYVCSCSAGILQDRVLTGYYSIAF